MTLRDSRARGRSAAVRVIAVALGALALLSPRAANAQASCTRAAVPPGAASHPTWPAPLDRVLAFQARDVSLRDALGQLAAAARLRLSYSSELLPLDRRVCVSEQGAAVGDLLAELLRGTSLEPRVVAADHIALAPVVTNAGAVASSSSTPQTARTTTVLDRVVVTGSTVGAPLRGLSVAVDVLSGSQLERRAADGTLSRILGGSVPGVWMWEQSPSSLLARYGSIRGASSFSASYPKVYIDGIEVANPLLVTQLSPDMVERIEVIRGPQGAALYGTDAISGVINIVTRSDGVVGGAPRLRLLSDAGLARSDFASGASLAQHHALTLRAGSGVRSAGLGVTVGTAGAFLPGSYSRNVTATGSARIIGSRSVLTATGRFVAEQASPAVNPLIGDSVPQTTPESPSAAAPTSCVDPQSVRQYTLGASARVTANSRWTHSAVVGLDGYRLSEIPDDIRAIPVFADAGLHCVRGLADRGTLRLSSVASFGDERTGVALTFAAEHSVLREGNDPGDGSSREQHDGGPQSGVTSLPSPLYATSWRSNTGLIAQTNVSLLDALYLTGGVRLERNQGFTAANQLSTLPMLGVSFVRDQGDLTVKLRAAYGKGIRPQRVPGREMWGPMRGRVTNATLAPEQQSGVEAGVDLLVGRRLTLQATRFDQLASGLIQPVALRIEDDTDPTSPAGRPRIPHVLQNVGQIANRGWELSGTANLAAFALNGAISLVDSRVRRLAPGYTGDLRAGDRMLEVPARTTSVTASWSDRGWFGALTASRASDWVNYDRLALAWSAASGPRPSDGEMGAWLRSFWRGYDGVTRLRLTTSRDVRRGLAVVLTGDNLLDYQLGEPDNVTVLPGRTITLGVRAAF